MVVDSLSNVNLQSVYYNHKKGVLIMILFIKWIALALAIMFVGWIVPGITISSFVTALVASVVIALVNLFIKPILVFLTLPINILTLGIFILVIKSIILVLKRLWINGKSIYKGVYFSVNLSE